MKPDEKPAQRSELLSMMNKVVRSSSRVGKNRTRASQEQIRRDQLEVETSSDSTTCRCYHFYELVHRTKLVKVKPAQSIVRSRLSSRAEAGQNDKKSDLNTQHYADYFSVFKSIYCVVLSLFTCLNVIKPAEALNDKGRKVQQCQKTFQRLQLCVQRANCTRGYIKSRAQAD
ncbi:hypothetical protein F511_21733 [Dorcoceras hygrometricum]|uniref:Uncharacterized protein n=1 Tax=Dorcoceras hygrometricum TaxID=472368 RepID=A0A2Z7BQ53_9LAMI|nr:hypothetical protein F511_21733 [Dorcoceras hygrometricum]